MKIEKRNFNLFSIIKRDDLSKRKAMIIRISSFIITFLFAILLCLFVVKDNYFRIIGALFEGAFILPWKLILDACLLLGFGIAIVPAFKMKYWNMGANGQVLMGALTAVVIMFYLSDFAYNNTSKNVLLLIIMLVSSIIASVIWAVIPAIFKVLFKTNETLFTLMMNNVAMGIVAYVNYFLTDGKQESLGKVNRLTHSGWLPVVIDKYFISIVVIIVMTIIINIYMSKTKHGYEISVVGDSINTARYVGMKTKTIIIRTLILSGVLCGIIGFLYASAINQSINVNLCGSLGFTAVLIAWLSNFNPLIMALISFLLAFLTNGTAKISSIYCLESTNLSSVIIGMIFFSILISEFFIKFRIKVNKVNKKVGVETC